MTERGVRQDEVLLALREGRREPAQRGLWQYRITSEFNSRWAGKYYAVKQVMPIVAEEAEQYVVVTVYAFYFQEGQER